MKRNKLLVSIMAISAMGILLLFPQTSLAAEGGQIGQTAGIEFYEETPQTKDSTKDSTKSDERLPNTTIDSKEQKPVGKYPNTGEIVTKSLGLSGAAMIVLVSLFFLLKKHKERKNAE